MTETPGNAVDPAAFKAALSRFAAGVTVITACQAPEAEGGPHDAVGMTATAFMSVSLEPPLVLVSLRRRARMREVLVERPLWAVSVLAESQRHIAGRFAIPGRVSDRLMFADIPHRYGPVTGAPVVGGALAVVECRTHSTVEAGDHTLVVGEVLSVDLPSPEGVPLVHFRGRYRGLRG